MIKYRFRVLYQTKNMREACAFLKKCDLGMGEIGLEETIVFNYILEEKPISYFKELIEQAYENLDCRVIKIEGGTIE